MADRKVTANKFFRIYKKEPHLITKREILDYIKKLIKEDCADNTINVHFHALKFFYENVLGKRLMANIPWFKVRKRLPECLTQTETIAFFDVIKNPKHKLIVLFIYGCGFRVSEAVKLKVKDLQLDSSQGRIRDGKGGKDRIFIIPNSIKDELKSWIKKNRLKDNDWLFPGHRNKHYSDSSIRMIIKKANKLAKIKKKITPHTLRHSFATHLLENGYTLIEVNRLLGHSRMETTMIYTHLAKPKFSRVKSPLDTLEK